MKRRTLLSLSAAVLILGGCAARETPLFERSGRFSLVSISSNLMTPLNGILARIEVTTRGAVLQTARDEQSFSAPTAEELMERVTGISVPVEALEQWLTTTDDQISEYGWSVRVLKRRSDGMPGKTQSLSACSGPTPGRQASA